MNWHIFEQYNIFLKSSISNKVQHLGICPDVFHKLSQSIYCILFLKSCLLGLSLSLHWLLSMWFLHTDKPSAPQNLSVTEVTSESCVFHWETPADNGGCEIKQYVIEKREANRRSWNKVGTVVTLEMTITKLVKNTTYVFRVAAENEVGVGEFAELPEPVTAKETFSESCLSLLYCKLCLYTWWIAMFRNCTFQNFKTFISSVKLNICMKKVKA